ncbi:MAG: S8 family serine peptidase [bacterium]|nr:S8 family serine peptidase [bacterium]
MSANVLHVRFRTARSAEAANAVLPVGFVIASPFLPPTNNSFPKSAPNARPAPARDKLERTFVVKLDASMTPLLAARLLMTKHADAVEYAEPWYIDQPNNTPNDPMVVDQQYLTLINAFEAWDSGTGDTSVVMGICDNGMDQQHEDLAPNIAINTNEIPANGVDDDANGYVDDYNGYNLAWRDDNTLPGDTRNNRNDGHGTKVAGLAGAASDNGIGITGIGRRCRIFPLKVSSIVSGGISYGYQGLIYAAQRGFNVVNCSWGTVKPSSPIDQSVIDFCAESNVVVVASSGNHGDSFPGAAWMLLNYPAAYSGVIGVGETNAADAISTATGLALNADVLAPASDALTTLSGGGYSDQGVRGSSFAAPMVTGMVGLVRSKYPALTVDQVQAFVRASVLDISGRNASFAIPLPGRIDLKKAMTTDPFSVAAVVVKSSDTRYKNGVPADRIVQGDTLAITFTLVNMLAPVKALTCNLAVLDGSGWQMRVISADASLGDLATGASIPTPAFLVVVDSIDEAQAILQLNFEAQNYSDQHFHYLAKPSPMATFENDELVYSMGDNGLVAFDESMPDRRGLGFNWKPSFFLMSPSGFLICEGGVKGLGAYNNNTYTSDFTPVKRFAQPERERSEMSDANVETARKIGVLVSQRCTFPSNSAKSTVWTVTVKNTSGTDLHDIAAGYYLDIDIGPRGENNAIRLAPEAIPTTFAAEPVTAMVVSRENTNASVVMAVHTNNSQAQAQAAASLLHGYVGDGDGFTDADRVLLLTSGDTIQTTSVGDIWGVVGMKFPGVLAPDDIRTFIVVVGVGATLAEAAQEVKTTLSNPLSVAEQPSALRATVRPNPASEYIAIDHPEGVSRIQLVDVFGSSVVYDANNEGGQSTIISTAHLAPGAYRCVITSATRSIVTLPFVVVR